MDVWLESNVYANAIMLRANFIPFLAIFFCVHPHLSAFDTDESTPSPPPPLPEEDTLPQLSRDQLLKRIEACYKPGFFIISGCGTPTTIQPLWIAARDLAVDITRLPLSNPNSDFWIHIDIFPSPHATAAKSTIKISYAMLTITDSYNRFLGRVAEQVPCQKANHTQYLNGKAKILELYENPTIHRMHIIECPTHENFTSVNLHPTVATLNFVPPVKAFYVNFKFTKDEVDYLTATSEGNVTNSLFLTTMITDKSGACYLHRLTHLKLRPRKEDPVDSFKVPLPCHDLGNPFLDETGATSPLLMSQTYKPQFTDIHFISNTRVHARPKARMVRPLKDAFKHQIDEYNLKVRLIDAHGNLPGTKANGTYVISAQRRPEVPLLFVGEFLEEPPVTSFDSDDEECDDNLRSRRSDNIVATISKMYLDCDFLTGCIGEPFGCVTEKNCDFLVSFVKEGDFVRFEVLALAWVYVAVGLSFDKLMGNDSVTECALEDNRKVFGYTSWNGENKTNTRRRSCVTMQDFVGGLLVSEGQHIIHCTWKRPVVSRVKGVTFDMRKPLYLQVVTGLLAGHGVLGNVQKHTNAHTHNAPLVLASYFGKSPLVLWLLKGHGVAMLVTWFGIIPVATFLSRYFKATFVKVRLCQKYSFWFIMHVFLVTLAILLTWGSIALLFVLDSQWMYGEMDLLYSWHSLLGFSISCLLLLQVILAGTMLKCQKSEVLSKVPLPYAHGFIGQITFFVAYACVFTAQNLQGGLPCDTYYPLIWYLGVYVVFHIIMSWSVCYTDFVEGRESSRVYKIFRLKAPDKMDVDEPGGKGRKVILGTLLPILTGFLLYFTAVTLMPSHQDCVTVERLRPPRKYIPGSVPDD